MLPKKNEKYSRIDLIKLFLMQKFRGSEKLKYHVPFISTKRVKSKIFNSQLTIKCMSLKLFSYNSPHIVKGVCDVVYNQQSLDSKGKLIHPNCSIIHKLEDIYKDIREEKEEQRKSYDSDADIFRDIYIENFVSIYLKGKTVIKSKYARNAQNYSIYYGNKCDYAEFAITHSDVMMFFLVESLCMFSKDANSKMQAFRFEIINDLNDPTLIVYHILCDEEIDLQDKQIETELKNIRNEIIFDTVKKIHQCVIRFIGSSLTHILVEKILLEVLTIKNIFGYDTVVSSENFFGVLHTKEKNKKKGKIGSMLKMLVRRKDNQQKKNLEILVDNMKDLCCNCKKKISPDINCDFCSIKTLKIIRCPDLYVTENSDRPKSTEKECLFKNLHLDKEDILSIFNLLNLSYCANDFKDALELEESENFEVLLRPDRQKRCYINIDYSAKKNKDIVQISQSESSENTIYDGTFIRRNSKASKRKSLDNLKSKNRNFIVHVPKETEIDDFEVSETGLYSSVERKNKLRKSFDHDFDVSSMDIQKRDVGRLDESQKEYLRSFMYIIEESGDGDGKETGAIKKHRTTEIKFDNSDMNRYDEMIRIKKSIIDENMDTKTHFGASKKFKEDLEVNIDKEKKSEDKTFFFENDQKIEAVNYREPHMEYEVYLDDKDKEKDVFLSSENTFAGNIIYNNVEQPLDKSNFKKYEEKHEILNETKDNKEGNYTKSYKISMYNNYTKDHEISENNVQYIFFAEKKLNAFRKFCSAQGSSVKIHNEESEQGKTLISLFENKQTLKISDNSINDISKGEVTLYSFNQHLPYQIPNIMQYEPFLNCSYLRFNGNMFNINLPELNHIDKTVSTEVRENHKSECKIEPYVVEIYDESNSNNKKNEKIKISEKCYQNNMTIYKNSYVDDSPFRSDDHLMRLECRNNANKDQTFNTKFCFNAEITDDIFLPFYYARRIKYFNDKNTKITEDFSNLDGKIQMPLQHEKETQTHKSRERKDMSIQERVAYYNKLDEKTKNPYMNVTKENKNRSTNTNTKNCGIKPESQKNSEFKKLNVCLAARKNSIKEKKSYKRALNQIQDHQNHDVIKLANNYISPENQKDISEIDIKSNSPDSLNVITCENTKDVRQITKPTNSCNKIINVCANTCFSDSKEKKENKQTLDQCSSVNMKEESEIKIDQKEKIFDSKKTTENNIVQKKCTNLTYCDATNIHREFDMYNSSILSKQLHQNHEDLKFSEKLTCNTDKTVLTSENLQTEHVKNAIFLDDANTFQTEAKIVEYKQQDNDKNNKNLDKSSKNTSTPKIIALDHQSLFEKIYEDIETQKKSFGFDIIESNKQKTKITENSSKEDESAHKENFFVGIHDLNEEENLCSELISIHNINKLHSEINDDSLKIARITKLDQKFNHHITKEKSFEEPKTSHLITVKKYEDELSRIKYCTEKKNNSENSCQVKASRRPSLIPKYDYKAHFDKQREIETCSSESKKQKDTIRSSFFKKCIFIGKLKRNITKFRKSCIIKK
ncbi:hypothetical protein EDEG_03043 [Edhazardia aedis USNM 41457]|uniref:Uncharacterized protein n=1 Tax=Edhazardia aedis (strain USNM 41457) TaxID=1003232 RepID=J9D3Z5_EDHAE|nr:hypothetical protein EDEG_03043 [Edhazardia aedis USNM 41457]|eukprot:EJW02531.1 hypothetical protein EDEG_03043 [Edhazardia aedis USNM 41457]